MRSGNDNLIVATVAGIADSPRRNHPETPAWQQQIASAIREPAELLQALNLDPELLNAAHQAAEQFPLMLPRNMLRRIKPGDPNDPVLRQFLPLGAELDQNPPHFSKDPLAEHTQVQQTGLIQKYAGRALLTLGNSCAVNCRYCFRRSFPYSEHRIGSEAWASIEAWLQARPEISEAILSGGDPLVISDQRLTSLGNRIADIPSIRRIRIHTRLPTSIPARVTPALLNWIEKLPVPLAIVLHCNHAQEIDPEVGSALQRLRRAGAHLLNQSVLLAGVNDDPASLAALSEALFDEGVLPYYLHLLDPVTGSAHFDVSEMRAIKILSELREMLPGYLVPRLVREVPGEACKHPVA